MNKKINELANKLHSFETSLLGDISKLFYTDDRVKQNVDAYSAQHTKLVYQRAKINEEYQTLLQRRD